MFIVYELWNPLTDVCFYVGKGTGTDQRRYDHLSEAGRYIECGKMPKTRVPLAHFSLRDETKKKVGDASRGRRFNPTDEAKRKISESKKALYEEKKEEV